MKHLKIKIEELLFAICANVFLEEAEDDSPFPYLVYSIKNGVNNHSQMIYTLDIDIWDKAETTEGIDELAKEIKKLDEVCYIDENIQFVLYFDRIINTKSEHKELKRYTCMFEVRVMERS